MQPGRVPPWLHPPTLQHRAEHPAASPVWTASTAWPNRHRLRDASRAILGEQPSQNYPCGPPTNRRPCDNAGRTPATAPGQTEGQQPAGDRHPIGAAPALFTGIGRDPHEHGKLASYLTTLPNPSTVAHAVADRRPGVAVSNVEGRRRLVGSVRRGVSLLRPAPTGPSRQAGRRMMTNPCIRCGQSPAVRAWMYCRAVLADHHRTARAVAGRTATPRR